MDMTLGEALARTITALLAERRIDHKTFAAAVANTSQSTVYRQLAGETKINTDQLEYLAEALGVAPADLLRMAMETRARLGTAQPAVREVRVQRIEAEAPTSATPDQR